MKFLYSILLCFLTWNIGMTQCTISGLRSSGIGDSEEYSILDLGQCDLCHQWEVTSGNGIITSSDNVNPVTVLRTGAGPLTINVIYFDGNVCNPSCTRIILEDVPCENNYTVSISDLYLDGFSGVSLFANTNPAISSGAVYNWKVTYDSGPDYTIVNTTNFVIAPLPSNRAITGASVRVYYEGCFFSDNHIFNPPITSNLFELNGEQPQNNFEIQSIGVYPNPTTGELNVIGLPLEGHTISILDLQGKAIINNAPIDQSLNISDQATGIYHFIINNANGIVKSGKIIKE